MNHKTAVVSAMSIAGVMVAGATALGANLGIVGAAEGVGDLSSVIDPTATTLPLATSLPPAPPLADLVAYQVNGVGVITVARDGDRLTLSSADVGDWGYEVKSQGEKLAVAFRTADREIQLEAAVSNGQVVLDAWEEQVITDSASSGSSTAVTSAVTTPATTSVTQPGATSSVTYDDSYDDSYEDSYDFSSDDSYDESYEDD